MVIGRYHYNEQACGGDLGEKEKQKGLYAMRRGGTGEVRVVRNSLTCA